MDKVLSIGTIILANIALGSLMCPENYYTSEEPDSIWCVRIITKELPWYDAQQYCKKSNENLVTIETRPKEDFVLEVKDMYSTGVMAWTGLNDVDVDGTYEYISGTIFNYSRPGLGQFAISSIPNPHLKKKPLCVAVDKFVNGWISTSCNKRYWFVCEFELNSAIEKKDPIPICTSQSCLCDKAHWQHFEARDIYYRYNKAVRNFKDAALLCDLLGGQLLKVPDEETTKFLTDMDVTWSPKGIFYWTGLFKKGNSWTWTDGTKLSSQNYTDWFTEPAPGKECVAAVWDYWGKWRGVQCNAKHYHVCETQYPCTAMIVFKMDGVEHSNNDTVSKMRGQKSTLRCEVIGYQQIVTMINASCGQHVSSAMNPKKYLDIKVTINIKMHNKPCVCNLVYTDGTTDEIGVVINFKIEPHLRNGTDNNKILHKSEGEKVILTFETLANPRPDAFRLVKDGSLMNVTEYNVTLQPLGDPLYYGVTLKIGDKYSSKMAGNYTLLMRNNVQGVLTYAFELRDCSHCTIHSHDFTCEFMRLIVMAVTFFVFVCLIMIVWRVVKIRGKSQQKEEEQQDSPSAMFLNYQNFANDEDSTVYIPPRPLITTRYGRYDSTTIR